MWNMQEELMNGVILRKYDSIADFEKFINDTTLNTVFRWAQHQSVSGSSSFTGTHNYEEAVDLLKHGADDLSKRLEKAYQVKAADIGTKTSIRSHYDVAGFQASVPRYLQGIPTSMVNQKKVVQKAKVVTLNKDMNYNAGWSTEAIINESAKALAIIKKLESTGVRVNLNLCWVAEAGIGRDNQKVGCKIRIKNAGERLNVSKLAFVMAHPSMLRRMLFRWLEVNPDVTTKSYTHGYGHPYDIKTIQEKSEYTLPIKIFNIDKTIKDMQEAQDAPAQY
jgi:hypothetical protein